MALDSGTSLGPYKIIAPLGAGGMGEVYRAQDTRLDREVAVKVLPAHLSASPEARQRFEREARSASSLNHPNICTLHDIGSHDGVDYLVMELLEGETLAERLQRGPMPLDEALAVAIALADALIRAHGNGLVHRDLKPGNVMLGKESVKLMDFGLAKGLEAAAPGDLTSTPTMTSPLTAAGMIMGTFQYMAPEQIEGKEADARSDIFAFGTILYEMVVGRKAFQGETHASLIASILKEEPAPIPDIGSQTTAAFDRAVRRCLAKDPEKRWQTVRDLGAELQWIASGDERSGAALATETGEAVRSGKGLPVWTWPVAAVMAALLFAAGWLLHRPAVPATQVIRSSMLLPPGMVLDTNNKSVALSPDGTMFAYAGAARDGETGIWVRRLDSLDAQHLAGTDAATYPFWSPDSSMLGFFSAGKLRKVPAAGGTVQTICDASDGRGASWGADGVIVFAPAPYGPLMQVSAAGGTPTAATTEERSDWTHRNPHFLPDGRKLLYLASSAGLNEGGIYSLDLSNGETSLLAEEASEGIFVEPGYLAFVRESNLMVQPIDRQTLELTGEAVPLVESVQFNTFRWTGTYSFSPTGLLLYRRGSIQIASQLTWFDLEGNELGTVGSPATFWLDADISPDSRRAVTAVRHADGKSDLWMYDLERGVGSKFTFGDVTGVSPQWSPDGTEVVFSDAGARILVKAADGTGTWRVISPEGVLAMDWTPDGSQILVMRQTQANTDLVLVPASGEGTSTPVIATPANETGGRFSPDGRWLAFLSDESDRREVYIVAFPGLAGKWQLSHSGAEWLSWLPDGSGILYATANGNLFSVPIEAQGSNLEIGATRQLDFSAGDVLTPVRALAPDGKRILAAASDADQAPSLTLVTNWAAELQ